MKRNEHPMMTPERLDEARQLGEKLARLRMARRIRQADAATRAGLSRSTAVLLEKGDLSRTQAQILRYLEAIAPGVSLTKSEFGTPTGGYRDTSARGFMRFGQASPFETYPCVGQLSQRMRRAWRRWKALGAVAALLSIQACTHTIHGPSLAETRSLAERVAAEGVVQVPLVIHRGYPFVTGEVNGQRGHFMVDNGTPFRFFLNSHYAPVSLGPEIGRGRAGSGQPIVVHEGHGVRSLRLGPDAGWEVQTAQAAAAAGIKAADFSFLEAGLQPDFLGFIGAPWLSSFAFSLRYVPARWLITDAGAGAQRLLEGSERVVLIPFEGQDGPLPYATLQVGDENLRARFDTGTPGVLQLTAEFRTRLERAGALRCSESNEPTPTTQCELKGLRYGATHLELQPLSTSTGSDNRITLGAALLSRYVTVWNLSQSTIDLRRDTSP